VITVPEPPPLPKIFPPRTTGYREAQDADNGSTVECTTAENDYIEPQQYDDSMFDDGPLNLSVS